MVTIDKDQYYELIEVRNLIGLPYEVLRKDASAGKLVTKKDYKRQRPIYMGKVVTGKNVLRYLTKYHPRILRQLNLESVTDKDCKQEDYNLLKKELECLRYQQQEYNKLLKVLEARISTIENKLKSSDNVE